MTAAGDDTGPRWRPDDQLVPAILAGSSSATMRGLTPTDRAWAIAGLRRAGCSAEETLALLGGSIRTLRTDLAGAAVAVCDALAEETDHFTRELQMVREELRRRGIELANVQRARDRYKNQLDNLLDAHLMEGAIPTFPCGCPRTRYNTYTAPNTGKEGCREHRRQAVAKYRERLKESLDSGVGAVDSIPCSPQGTD